MTETSLPLAPTRTDERYDAMDVLRGFALCGILLMNIIGMGASWEHDLPALPASTSDPSWVTWFVQNVLFEGTMRGLFTLLFGAAVILITRKGDRPGGGMQAADVYFRRCLFLMLLGLLNFTLLLWPGDILWNYGVAGLFLFVFRKSRPRTLFILAGLIIAFLALGEGMAGRDSLSDWRAGEAAAEAQAAGETLSEDQTTALEDRRETLEYLNPTEESLAEEAGARRADYPALIGWSFSKYAEWGLSGWGIFAVMESVAFMWIGMALFRMRVITGERSLGFYVACALIGYALGGAINVWEHVTLWNAGFTPEAWGPAFTYEPSRLLMTLGHLGLVMAMWKANALGFVGASLRAIGKLALTNYLGQSLIAAVVFYGLGWWGRLNWAELWGVAAAIWVGQAIFSILWLRAFAIGPMEWLLRAVAYGKRPPFRRRTASEVVI